MHHNESLQGQHPQVQLPSSLTALFPRSVIAVETHRPADHYYLHPEEARYVTAAVPKRIREFATGRACARRALAMLGVTDFPLRVGPMREPLWPAGVVGSITHTVGYCGVVAARLGEIRALGIDAELLGTVSPEMWNRLMTEREIHWLSQLDEGAATTWATVLFSVKEAFYKCQHSLTGEWLDFSDVTVIPEEGTFRVQPQRLIQLESLAPPPWTGRFVLHDNIALTGIYVSLR